MHEGLTCGCRDCACAKLPVYVILIAPSTSAASGVTTYVCGLARVVDLSSFAFLAVPGSDLARSLPKSATQIATNGSRAQMAEVLRRQRRDFTLLHTHGRRPLLSGRQARWPGDRLTHTFHESPRAHPLRSGIEVALATRARIALNAPGTARWARAVGRGRPVALFRPSSGRSAPYPVFLLGANSGLRRIRLCWVLWDACPQSRNRSWPSVPPRISRATADLLRSLSLVRDRGARHSSAVPLGSASTPALSAQYATPESCSVHRPVLLAPSRRETFGLAMAESLVAGIPVASVDSPGGRLLSEEGTLFPLAQSSRRGARGQRRGSPLQDASGET